MNALMLLFALLSLSLAGYPVDFAGSEPREAVDGVLPAFWLDPGVYYADVSSRTDLNASYLELQFAATQIDVECFYSVFFNDKKISWGNFNSATSSVIPLIGVGVLELSADDDNMLMISTSNCYLGRFAVPYKMGDNGNALYLVDLHPTTQVDLVDWDQTTRDSSTAMNYFPGYEYGYGYQGVESWQGAIQTSGLCKFSSQACTVSEGGFWMPSYEDYIGVKIDWSDATFYDLKEFDGEVVIENSGWFTGAFRLVYQHCNTTQATGDCDTLAEFKNYNGFAFGNYEYQGNQQGGAQNSPGQSYTRGHILFDVYNDDKKRSEEVVSPLRQNNDYDASRAYALNTTRAFYRLHYTYVPDSDGDLEDSLAIFYTTNQVVFPYAKVWALGITDDMHILADLRESSSNNNDCHSEHGLKGYTAEVGNGYPTYGGSWLSWNNDGGIYTNWPVAYPNVDGNSDYIETNFADTGVGFGYTPQQEWLYCGQKPAGSDLSCDNIRSEFNSISFTKGTVLESETIDVVEISLPNGGFINPVVFDLGLPIVNSPSCTFAGDPTQSYVFAPYENFAANQLSSYDIYVNDVMVGHHEQSFIKRFDRAMISGFGVEGFILDANTSNLKFQYKSTMDFSITASSYIQINAFPAVVCVDDDCGVGTCADPYVSTACDCPITHTGDACADLVQFCATDDETYGCLNGGVCRENEERWIAEDVAGFELFVVDATYCDCVGTNTTLDGATGDFRGAYCEIAAPCNANPCLHDGAVCMENDKTSEGYTCDCDGTMSPNSTEPYTGSHCEFPATTVCDVHPCENGGECEVDETEAGGYKCTCIDDWTGPTCAIAPTGKCSDAEDHCGAYGYCISGSDPSTDPAFTQCVCLYGYTGATCDTQPEACTRNSVTCENGGSCIGFGKAATDAWSCLCVEPWVGSTCQWNNTFEATVASNPTQN